MMTTVAVTGSSSLACVGYAAEAETLEVTFCHGARYRYFGVPEAVHIGLLGSDSKGRYFNARIRGAFAFEVVR